MSRTKSFLYFGASYLANLAGVSPERRACLRECESLLTLIRIPDELKDRLNVVTGITTFTHPLSIHVDPGRENWTRTRPCAGAEEPRVFDPTTCQDETILSPGLLKRLKPSSFLMVIHGILAFAERRKQISRVILARARGLQYTKYKSS